MKRIELSFCCVQKSAQESERKGDTSLNVYRSGRRNVRRTEGTPHPMHEYQKRGDREWGIRECVKEMGVIEWLLATDEFQNGKNRPSTPSVFVSADSKELAGWRLVNADFARLKVAGFSVIWECLISAVSKVVTDAIYLQ